MASGPPALRTVATLGVALLAVALVGAALARRAHATPHMTTKVEGPPTVVLYELYTSEGCSSCPPADGVLARLARGSATVPGVRVVPLAFHVDYWDDLGWPDPFASPRWTARQQAYGRALGQRGVYTPEAIVDGAVHFVGSDEDRALEELASAAKRPHARVDVTVVDPATSVANLRVRVTSLPAVSAGDAAEVWIASTEDGLAIDVRRGENAGRRLDHDAVVRTLVRAGEVRGDGGTLDASVPTKERTARVHVVAFVQERSSRRILGAGVL